MMKYGTSGFRALGNSLADLVQRCCVASIFLSQKYGQLFGLMITASHNPAEDNGVKLIYPNGETLPVEYESMLTEIVNDDNKLKEIRLAVCNWQATQEQLSAKKPRIGVILGMDQRPSSPMLMQSAEKILGEINQPYVNVGYVTTPICHYIVYQSNLRECEISDLQKLDTFNFWLDVVKSNFQFQSNQVKTKYQTKIVIDGANSVGGLYAKKLQDLIQSKGIQLILINSESGEPNKDCGAEHVQKKQALPQNFDPQMSEKAVSFDGDADRLIYFTSSGQIIDGIKLLCLYVTFLRSFPELSNVKIGAVTTAYSNQASTKYLSQFCEVKIVPTGVKWLHPEAKRQEIGVWFESNGHGTITIQQHVIDQLPQESFLRKFLSLVNQVYGDAIIDFLLAEMALNHLDWDLQTLFNLYKEVPYKYLQLKTNNSPKVSLLKLKEDESEVLEPVSLREAIMNECKKYSNGRYTVRPSGTEPVIRIYAEADEGVEELCGNLYKIVQEFLA